MSSQHVVHSIVTLSDSAGAGTYTKEQGVLSGGQMLGWRSASGNLLVWVGGAALPCVDWQLSTLDNLACRLEDVQRGSAGQRRSAGAAGKRQGCAHGPAAHPPPLHSCLVPDLRHPRLHQVSQALKAESVRKSWIYSLQH